MLTVNEEFNKFCQECLHHQLGFKELYCKHPTFGSVGKRMSKSNCPRLAKPGKWMHNIENMVMECSTCGKGDIPLLDKRLFCSFCGSNMEVK